MSADLLALLDQLDEARAKATAGPWAQNGADPAYVIGQVSEDGEEYLDVADAGAGVRPGEWKRAEADAALIVAAVNAIPELLRLARERYALERALLALADEWDTQHSGWCCTVDCPEPGGRHHDPTDPVSLDELAGAWSDNPPPMREHRTIPCPGTCTCQVGPYIAALRAALAPLAGQHTTDEEGR